MKRWMGLVLTVVLLAVAAPVALAADFGWFNDFNLRAQADPAGFRARLATRFKIGDAQISAVVGNVPDPADAYMVFRLGEISHHPPERVLDVYRESKGKGWGAMAKELGIKPGSKAFHALKRGHDFGGDYGGGKKAKKSKGKSKGGDQDRDRDRDRDRGRVGR